MNPTSAARSWVMLLIALAIGGVVLVYTLAQLMFPKTDVAGLARRAAVAGALGGCVLGAIAGAFASPKEAFPWLGLASAPLVGFGALLLPGVLEGHWVGVGIWWLGGLSLAAVGFGSCWTVHRFRNRGGSS